MSTPRDSWGTLGATLGRVLDAPPAWVSPETTATARVLLAALRADARRALDGGGLSGAVLGVSRAALLRARRDGWLSGE